MKSVRKEVENKVRELSSENREKVLDSVAEHIRTLSERSLKSKVEKLTKDSVVEPIKEAEEENGKGK